MKRPDCTVLISNALFERRFHRDQNCRGLLLQLVDDTTTPELSVLLTERLPTSSVTTDKQQTLHILLYLKACIAWSANLGVHQRRSLRQSSSIAVSHILSPDCLHACCHISFIIRLPCITRLTIHRYSCLVSFWTADWTRRVSACSTMQC